MIAHVDFASEPDALQRYEVIPNTLYTIEAAAHLAQVPRRRIALYCKHGFISRISNDPVAGCWFFNDKAIRELQLIEHLRAACGLNMTGIALVLSLVRELARLRDEVRDLHAWPTTRRRK